MMFKVGDIIRVKPFEPDNRYNGILCTNEMTKDIGRLHVITEKIGADVFKIDAWGDYYYPAEILEPVENDAPVYFFGEFPVVVTYDGSHWRTATGGIVSSFYVGLFKPGVIKLPYDVYNVGSKGADVEVVEFKGDYWLSPKYLPMNGIIE